MENGSGATQQASSPNRVIWPWEQVVNTPEPAPAPVFIPQPAVATGKGKYVRTEAHNKALRAGWAKRRQRIRMQEAAKALPANEATGIEKAIAYHRDALKTLLAAKALLK